MSNLYNFSLFRDAETSEVAWMHQKFGFTIGEKPTPLTRELAIERYEKMQEELQEYYDAVVADDFTMMADSLVDLAVFLKGTAVMMGLPWGHLWADVMRANLAKEVGVKENRPTHKQDLIKPDGWVGPQTYQILVDYGYEHHEENGE